MAVSDPTSVDQVAQGPDGRVVLAMTEDRPYTGGDTTLLVEEFRAKLNAYVYTIRSGQLAAAVPDARNGVDVLLYCIDPPPDEVQQMIGLAHQGLTGEGVRVGWQLLPPPSPQQLLTLLAASITDRAPTDWHTIDLTAALVGNGMTGDLRVTDTDGAPTALPPDQNLIQTLEKLKQALWDPDTGTWLSTRIHIDRDTVDPSFDYTSEPDGGDFTTTDYTEELRRYPRTTIPDWWQYHLNPHA